MTQSFVDQGRVVIVGGREMCATKIFFSVCKAALKALCLTTTTSTTPPHQKKRCLCIHRANSLLLSLHGAEVVFSHLLLHNGLMTTAIIEKIVNKLHQGTHKIRTHTQGAPCHAGLWWAHSGRNTRKIWGEKLLHCCLELLAPRGECKHQDKQKEMASHGTRKWPEHPLTLAR